MNTAQVLIIAEDAVEYAQHIDAACIESIPLATCQTIEDARAAYNGQPVLLGEPNLIAEVISDMPAVQWVQSTWAGVKPLLALQRSDYILTGVKGIFGQQMSEYVLAWLLAHELKVLERSELQSQRIWGEETSGSLAGKKAGIMGTGSIGSHIAIMLEAFGVHVTGLSRRGDPVTGFKQVYPVERLNEFLTGLDYLVSVLPETKSTHGLLNADAIACLPDQAVFINIGRGNVLDETALITALCNRQMAGAVLDVFNEEPLPADSPLWTTPNLIITPHVAATSHAADIAPIFMDNYQRYMTRQRLKYVIDFGRGY